MKVLLLILSVLVQALVISSTVIPDGLYHFTCKANKNVLDIERASHIIQANLIIFPLHGGTNQQFILTNIGQNYVTLIAKHSGQAITVREHCIGETTVEQDYLTPGNPYQEFKFIVTKDKHYLIQNKATGLYLNGDSHILSHVHNELGIMSAKACKDSHKFSISEVCQVAGPSVCDDNSLDILCFN